MAFTYDAEPVVASEATTNGSGLDSLLPQNGDGATTDAAAELRRENLERVYAYHDQEFANRKFVPGVSPVPVSGRVFDADDLVHLTDAALEFWLTAGRYAERFERDFARYLGARHALLCN